jgi:hypothetical protein
VIGPGLSACQASPGNYCGNPSCVGSWGENASFQKDAAGFVHLRGQAGFATGGICATDAQGIFYLPPGYRPTDFERRFVLPKCYGDGSDVMRVSVETGGLVRVLSGTAACMSLDPISFHP